MKKNKGILSLILTAVLVVLLGFTVLVGFGKTGTGAMKNIKLGLDLAGGVSITYQAKEENPSAEDMSDTQYKLQQRVQNYSSEAEVYQEGGNRINVDIPGVTDANKILEELGKPGSLQFYDENWNVVLEGTDVASAKAVIYKDQQTGNNNYEVALTFTDEGTKKFADVTAANVGKKIAIVYDNVMYSNPTVQQAITGGQASISGMTSYEEAENLASTIRIGSLSLELEELRSNVVGAKLGQEAITTSLKAGAIGFGIVCVFMIVVYLIPGLAASLALCLYVALMLILLAAFEVTLTLPGIAGIILSIGMAVDANVIIFARIREEIAAGKSVIAAIEIGFKKALSAIVDGNVTTLIAAAVLGVLGSGTVKGFAITLALGVVLSMFTALFITKILLNALYAVGLRDQKFYGKAKAMKNINFMSKKAVFFACSILVICVGFVGMGVHGAKGDKALNYSLEFLGGTSTTVEFNEAYTLAQADDEIVPKIAEVIGNNDIQTQVVDNTNQIIFKTRSLDLEQREALNTMLENDYGVDESAITSSNIGSTISGEMRSQSVIAVIVAAFFMLLYIWFRFKDIRFASSAIIALIHDVLVVLALYAVARISVGSAFIACMLTVIGYSVNDTIVIFDRIRENKKVLRDETPESLQTLANESITQTLSRSISTSFTTVVMVLMLLILGVTSIREFALPLLVGIVCGTYSSICIATELWYVMKVHIKGKKKAN